MKIRFRIFPLMALLLAALSCGKELAVDGDVTDGRLTAEGQDILCRTSAVMKTSLNDQMAVVWDKDDRIRVMGQSNVKGESYHIKELSSDGRTAVFTTEGKPVMDEIRYVLYPEASFKSFDASSLRMIVSMPVLSELSYLPMVASSQGSIFEFANLFGGLAVRPYDLQGLGLAIRKLEVASRDGKPIGADAVVDLEKLSIAGFQGNEASVSLDLEQAVSISSGGWTSWSTHNLSTFDDNAKEFVVYVPSGDYPSGFDVVMTDEDGRSYVYETGPMTIAPGRVTRLAYEPLTVYYGQENSVRVVPGTTSVKIDVTPYCTFSRSFQRDGRMVLSKGDIVSSAQVIWQQEYGCKTSDIMTTAQSGTVVPNDGQLVLSKADDGKVSMTVPLTGSAGNALVAVMDANGTILWSFHIWVGDAADVPCNNAIGGQYTLMDRNLGATSVNDKSQTTEELIRNSFGLFYQWGRKDPFPRLLHRTARVTANTYSAQLPFTNSVQRLDRNIGSIGYATRNPNQRIWLDNTTGCNWLTSYVGELWGFHYSSNSIDRLVSENKLRDGVKTVYDPCPAGYKVADVKHIKGLVELNAEQLTNRDKFYGYHFDTGASTTTYIPASGWVKSGIADNQALCYEGYWGMLWSSASGLMTVNYLYLHSASTAVFADSHVCVRGNMCPVRCVKIEK